MLPIIIKNLAISENFKLVSTTEASLFKLCKNFEATKAAEIDQISEKFLRNGA